MIQLRLSDIPDYADKAADILAKWRAGIFTAIQKNDMVKKLNQEQTNAKT